MASVVSGILARIVDEKKAELPALAARADALEQAAAQSLPRDFAGALQRNPPAIIAEIKKASPSKGILAAAFDPARIAAAYEHGGAAALSVLTDARHFQGSFEHLRQARAVVSIPVLRKDFTVDALNVLEAAAHGADAVLLIAAVLHERALRDLREAAERRGMAALVEVHSAAELDTALASGARIVGVNNRNLETFDVNLEVALRLADRIPAGVIKVAESGIHSSEDVRRLLAAGFQAFLVGEHLMKSSDAGGAVRALLQSC